MANKKKIDGQWHWPNGKPGPKPKPSIDRFWSKVKKTKDGCWRWLGHINEYGYARFQEITRGDPASGASTAHVFSFKYFVGPIPKGYELHHKCEHKDCSNFEHLELKTKLEHLKTHRPVRTQCDNGHELNEQNLYVAKNGYRRCRICAATYARKYYTKNIKIQQAA